MLIAWLLSEPLACNDLFGRFSRFSRFDQADSVFLGVLYRNATTTDFVPDATLPSLVKGSRGAIVSFYEPLLSSVLPPSSVGRFDGRPGL